MELDNVKETGKPKQKKLIYNLLFIIFEFSDEEDLYEIRNLDRTCRNNVKLRIENYTKTHNEKYFGIHYKTAKVELLKNVSLHGLQKTQALTAYISKIGDNYNFPRGDIYQGDVVNKNYHGNGKYKWKKYENFEWLYQCSEHSFQGMWENGNFVKGFYYLVEVEEHESYVILYKGNFLNNKPHGRGLYIKLKLYPWNSINKFKGIFENGKSTSANEFIK